MVVVTSQIIFFILYLTGILKSKIALFALGLIPWIRYLYGIIFSKLIVWDEFSKKKSDHFIRQSAYWHETHISFFEGHYAGFQLLISSFEMIALRKAVQVYKGSGKIFVLWFLIFSVIMIVGFFRIKGDDKLRQMIRFGFIVAFFVYLTVNTTCFFMSSAARHETCEFTSKNSSSSGKGGTSYYVTVELGNGDTYKSLVDSSTYKKAESAELVACYNDGPWGIEYLRVHEAK